MTLFRRARKDNAHCVNFRIVARPGVINRAVPIFPARRLARNGGTDKGGARATIGRGLVIRFTDSFLRYANGESAGARIAIIIAVGEKLTGQDGRAPNAGVGLILRAR